MNHNIFSGRPASINQPIHLNVAYCFKSAGEAERVFTGEKSAYMYGRLGNPNSDQWISNLAKKENAKFGVDFNMGLTALCGLWLYLAEPGKNIVTTYKLYGGTYDFLMAYQKLGVEVRLVESSQDYREWDELTDKNTIFLLAETISNPLSEIFDIERLSKIAHRKRTLMVADNTLASPSIVKPIDLGADIVWHSATKSLSTHGTHLAGALLSNYEEIIEGIKKGPYYNAGLGLQPFEAFLSDMALTDLESHVRKADHGARYLIEILEGHKKVKEVYYPGCGDLRQIRLRREQLSDHVGSVFSVELSGGGKKKAFKFINLLQKSGLFSIAPHLGFRRSLVVHPASTTHTKVPSEERSRAGVSDSLIRFAVGLEDEGELAVAVLWALDEM